MRHLIELSGESEGLARAEALGACSSAGKASIEETDGRALVIESGIAASELVARLGLAWSVSEHLFSCTPDDLEAHLDKLELPGKTFRVRARRLDAIFGPTTGQMTARKVGKILSARYRVDLESPDTEIRILMAKRLHCGILCGETDRSALESRRPENRPYNHPISLHPKLARALVNLARVRPGQTLLDPFCGTGGILIEAGMMGCRALGGDIDARMVEGTRRNLAHYGIGDAAMSEADISVWPSKHTDLDAIATDPPYGRSASTAKEPIESLYSRAFESCRKALKDGGRLAIVLPEKEHVSLSGGFELEGVHPVRVHRSLTRYFCVLRKP